MEKKKYFVELDALRCVGFLGIFFGHVFFTTNSDIVNGSVYQLFQEFCKILGSISLDSFFVLSSFLITWRGIEEIKKNNNFHFKNFFVRRALRIWPLYFFIVSIGFLFLAFTNYINYEINSLPSLWKFLVFIINFHIIENGYDFLFFMVFMWSISLEEQFYVFWGIVMSWFNKYILQISIIIIIASIGFRFYYINESLMLRFHIVSALGNFGIGALAAIYAFNQTKLLNIITKISKLKLWFIYSIMILTLILMPLLMESSIIVVLERIIFSLFFVFVILEQSFNQNSVFKLSIIKPFNTLGKISYGLYCYHGLVITFFVMLVDYLSIEETLIKTIIIYPFCILTFTIIISAISYKFFELRFLKFKRKFKY